jgi:uroporphyrinogen decarboxylase
VNSRERLLTALDHREPDRIPLDLGSTQATGIHEAAYRRLRKHMKLPPVTPVIVDAVQGLAEPDEDIIDRFGVDVMGLYPLNSHNWKVDAVDAGDNWEYLDEWGITHRKPKAGGLYYSIVKSPLAGEISADTVMKYPWPATGDPRRVEGLRERALEFRARGRAVMIKGVLTGAFEMGQRLRGPENLLMDLATDEEPSRVLLDKLIELKLSFWETALSRLGDVVDVIAEFDDYGTQESQLISRRMFRELFKPRLAVLFRRIRELAPAAKLFFHSCGNVRPLIPDFIELGVDILNPVHTRAAGMEPAALKRDFGKDIVFWGGGVDTQGILPLGTPQQVKDDVRRNIDALAPGGGYVFSTVHNIQADVPPANIVAMYEALRGE